MKNIIVTGANGFIGSSLIKKLIAKDVNVIAIDITFETPHIPESNRIIRIASDLSDMNALMGMIPENNYDAFYHFAWQGVNGPSKADPLIQNNNISMMLRCAGVASKLGCKKFLCSGTIAERAVESLPHLEKVGGGMMYGAAKHCAHIMLETYCKNIGLDFVWMQFSNIYGPENKTGNIISYTVGQLKKGEEASFGPAKQPYDLIYVEDLIEAVSRLGDVENPENFYFIGSGTPRILGDYLLITGRSAGHEELIKLGARPDDGIVYRKDMFDISKLVKDIGAYVSGSFEELIKYTIENY